MTHPDDAATIERDLSAVEAALADGAAVHDDPAARDLQELALVLRAQPARADAGFAEELRTRMEAGFPPKPGSVRAELAATRERQAAAAKQLRAALARRPGRARSWLVPAGIVTVVLLAIVASATLDWSGTRGEGADGGGVAESGGGGSAEQAPAQDGGGFVPGRDDRKIERSISMTLEAPEDEVAALAEDVTRVTGRHGGFVLQSELDVGEEGASGSFELRIPSPRLQAALRDLAGLATVRSQTQSGRDVTRAHVTAKDRLQSARAERRSLLRRLESATTDAEAEALRRRLDLVAGEINGLRAQLRDLRLRTAYAIVAVELAGEDGDSGSGGASASFDDAIGDAGDVLVGAAGVLVRVLAVTLPVALLGLVAWLASRVVRRRRRESALV